MQSEQKFPEKKLQKVLVNHENLLYNRRYKEKGAND